MGRHSAEHFLSLRGGKNDCCGEKKTDYARIFAQVYPEIEQGREVGFTDISNAIAVFMEFEWRSDDSPFDAFLRGQGDLPAQAAKGMDLFYGEAQCSTCHAGPFQTDHSFHAMGAPQLGPGKVARFEGHARDEGRFRVTGDPRDLYRFRTPSLRNVALTAPYGHAGAHRDLTAFLQAHTRGQPIYDRAQALLPELPGAEDWRILDDPEATKAVIAAYEGPKVTLSAEDISAIGAFLDTLTGATAQIGRLGVPDSVPSGLTVDK